MWTFPRPVLALEDTCKERGDIQKAPRLTFGERHPIATEHGQVNVHSVP